MLWLVSENMMFSNCISFNFHFWNSLPNLCFDDKFVLPPTFQKFIVNGGKVEFSHIPDEYWDLFFISNQNLWWKMVFTNKERLSLFSIWHGHHGFVFNKTIWQFSIPCLQIHCNACNDDPVVTVPLKDFSLSNLPLKLYSFVWQWINSRKLYNWLLATILDRTLRTSKDAFFLPLRIKRYTRVT